MKIDVNITRDDFAAFNKYYLRKKSKSRYLKWICLVFIIIYSFFIYYDNSNLLVPVLASILFAAIYLFILFIFQFLQLYIIRKIPSKKGSSLGSHKFVLKKDCIEESTENNSTSYKWAGIISLDITEKFIYLFVDNHMAHIFPTREFESEEQINEFINLVNKNLETSKTSTT